MSALLDELKAMGCDTEDALDRFLNNEEFFEQCLVKFLDDDVFETLGKNLSDQSIEDSFRSAHNLKGVCANLGITPMYTAIYDMVEDLRGGMMPSDAMERYQQIIQLRDDIKKLLVK